MRIFPGLQNENEMCDSCIIWDETSLGRDLDIQFFKVLHQLNFKGVVFIFNNNTTASFVNKCIIVPQLIVSKVLKN